MLMLICWWYFRCLFYCLPLLMLRFYWLLFSCASLFFMFAFIIFLIRLPCAFALPITLFRHFSFAILMPLLFHFRYADIFFISPCWCHAISPYWCFLRHYDCHWLFLLIYFRWLLMSATPMIFSMPLPLLIFSFLILLPHYAIFAFIIIDDAAAFIFHYYLFSADYLRHCWFSFLLLLLSWLRCWLIFFHFRLMISCLFSFFMMIFAFILMFFFFILRRHYFLLSFSSDYALMLISLSSLSFWLLIADTFLLSPHWYFRRFSAIRHYAFLIIERYD